jgi:hypothetical protein
MYIQVNLYVSMHIQVNMLAYDRSQVIIHKKCSYMHEYPNIYAYTPKYIWENV